ncbi:MAG: hypothetical protein ABIK31_02655 [candidate division WOR-3 bacterium]
MAKRKKYLKAQKMKRMHLIKDLTDSLICPSPNSGYTPLKRRIAAKRYVQAFLNFYYLRVFI